MSGLRTVIADLYRQVGAPAWAAPNLDGLADVLRDLSWLPPGAVTLTVADPARLSDRDREALRRVLRRAEDESRGTPRPVRADVGDPE